MEENIEKELITQDATIKDLKKQSTYLVDSLDKLTERFNGMGRTFMNSFKEIQEEVRSASKLSTPSFTVEPQCSPETGEIAKAMANAKADIKNIGKSGEIKGRGGYSKLEDLLEAIMPVLKLHELDASFWIFTNEYEKFVIKLRVSHSSGQWYATSALLREEESSSQVFHQKINSAETYMMRTMLKGMFSLVAIEGD